jgi:hypothetical protein
MKHVLTAKLEHNFYARSKIWLRHCIGYYYSSRAVV